MKARDCSNFTDDNIEQLMAQWYAEGDRLVLLQAFPPTHRNYPEQQRQIRAAVAQGMVWDAYIYDYLASPEWRDAALAGLSGHSPRLIWLDEEQDGLAWHISLTVNAIASSAAAVLLAGYRVGIYTGKWWWEDETGDSKDFAHLPLWDADYDGKQHTEVSWEPYGGWTERAIKQFAGSQPDGTDLNVLSAETEADVLALLNPEPEDTVRIPAEYVTKFNLRDDQDIDGLIANFEGVIRTVAEIEARKDEEAERRLEQIKELVNA